MRVELDIKETFNEQENESEIKITYTWTRQTAVNEGIDCTIMHYPISNDIQKIEVSGDSNPRWERIEGERGIHPIKLTGNKSGNPSPIKSAYIELSYRHTSRTAFMKDGKQDRKAFLVTDCGGSRGLDTEVTYSLIYPDLSFRKSLHYRRKITFFEKTPRIIVRPHSIFGNHEFGFKTTLRGDSVGAIIGVVETVPRLSLLGTAIISGTGVSSISGFFGDNIVQLVQRLIQAK